eukprot:NODE_11678_length_1271_cov_7.273601.p1 GENE.NODE_11678_length_1271_cov_7.273601~~NODE_11678_length_1271_cov_7.273601.p1  ORF type:complete len:247 (-),score=51.38 NODE_11678_length_1271_cov_7.273601:247-987(-)
MQCLARASAQSSAAGRVAVALCAVRPRALGTGAAGAVSTLAARSAPPPPPPPLPPLPPPSMPALSAPGAWPIARHRLALTGATPHSHSERDGIQGIGSVTAQWFGLLGIAPAGGSATQQLVVGSSAILPITVGVGFPGSPGAGLPAVGTLNVGVELPGSASAVHLPGPASEAILDDTDVDVPSATGEPSNAPAIECGQHWYRIIKNQRQGLKGVRNASKADCGPKKRHWRWYRDNHQKKRKKRRCI